MYTFFFGNNHTWAYFKIIKLGFLSLFHLIVSEIILSSMIYNYR